MGRVRKHSIEVIHQVCLDYMEGRGNYHSLAKR